MDANSSLDMGFVIIFFPIHDLIFIFLTVSPKE